MFKNKRSFQSKPVNVTEIESQKDAGKPERDLVSPDTDLIEKKTTAGLPKTGSSISVKADPYAQVLPDSDPYAVLNKSNPRVGGRYGGEDNIDGGATHQLVSSEYSNFLHTFDSMMVRIRANYRYLPISANDVDRGKGFVREMIQAIDEVLSLARSTTYTNLAINEYYIKTNLPCIKDNGSFESDANYEYSCAKSNGLYALLICYQTYLQSFASIFNSYNKFRANQGIMMKMSWNRQTPQLNSYFSLMNKNSMIGLFKSLAFVLNGEYFDKEWMVQYNMIASLNSRKSNAMTDPLKEVVATHELPSFQIYVKAGNATVDVFNTETFNTIIRSVPEFSSMTYQEALDHVCKRLSINDTLYWVRNSTAYAETTDQSRMNEVANFVQALIACAGQFKPAMGDLRTMLDTVQRVGVNKWSKSTQLEIYPKLSNTVSNNMTVNDIFKSMMSGSPTLNWNNDTFRWTVYTIWNYYDGIPEYDAKSGGSFLTFSTKDIEVPSNNPTAVDYLPKFIGSFLSESTGYRPGTIYAINRLGTSVELKKAIFNPSLNPSTARLVPLSTQSFDIVIPYTTAILSVIDKSFLQNACLRCFGSFSNGTTESINETTDLTVDNDYLCLLSVEINDLANEMITYSRTEGPFIVNYKDKSNIGFLGL